MSWRRITMKFPGTCIVCQEKMSANEVGLWSKGVGVKHEKCAEVKELPCMVCGAPAGCPRCEFQDDCDLENVSPFCICKKCGDAAGTFSRYVQSAQKKFPGLGAR